MTCFSLSVAVDAEYECQPGFIMRIPDLPLADNVLLNQDCCSGTCVIENKKHGFKLFMDVFAYLVEAWGSKGFYGSLVEETRLPTAYRST